MDQAAVSEKRTVPIKMIRKVLLGEEVDSNFPKKSREGKK